MKSLRNRIAIIAGMALFGLAGMLGGCGSDSTPTSPGSTFNPPPASSGSGLLALQIDAFGVPGEDGASPMPGVEAQGPRNRTEIADVIFTFDSIRVFAACADSDSVGHEDDEEDGDGEGQHEFEDEDCPSFEFLTEPVTVALGSLSDSLQALLGTLVIPEGDYRRINLHILEARVVTAADDTVEARVPSGDQSGLKVPVDFSVVAGEVSEIVISVDLGRSVVETPPGSLNFLIKPVLHGHHKDHDDDDHGNNGNGNGNDDDDHDDNDGENE